MITLPYKETIFQIIILDLEEVICLRFVLTFYCKVFITVRMRLFIYMVHLIKLIRKSFIYIFLKFSRNKTSFSELSSESFDTTLVDFLLLHTITAYYCNAVIVLNTCMYMYTYIFLYENTEEYIKKFPLY